MFGPEGDERTVQGVSLATKRVGVALGLVGGSHFHRSLGHDGAQSSILGGFVEERELLVGDGKFRVGLLEAVAQVEQPPFDGGPRHPRSVCRPITKLPGWRTKHPAEP